MPTVNTPRSGADGMPPDDWDLLFDAVAWRLRQCAHEAPALNVRATLEDCVRSLELLHAALGQERGYIRRIEARLQDACAMLDSARAELS